MKKLDASIAIGDSTSVKLKIRIPILKSSDFSKTISKAIFLYKTGNHFRVQRSVTYFNIHRVA
jgi:hypothetical protein